MVAERDEHGRFVKGHANVSPGRPPRATEDEYLRVMSEVVSADDWRAITLRARDDAIGHREWGARKAAREWLSDYLLPTKEQLVRLRGDGEAPAVVLREVVVERTA